MTHKSASSTSVCPTQGFRKLWRAATPSSRLGSLGALSAALSLVSVVHAADLYLDCADTEKVALQESDGKPKASSHARQFLESQTPPECPAPEIRNPETFVPAMAKTSELWIVNYYAGWCPHCITFAPAYKQLAKQYDGKVHFAAVNCEVHGGWCSNVGVSSYPTLRAYHEAPADASDKGDGGPLDLTKSQKHGPDRLALYTQLIDALVAKRRGNDGLPLEGSSAAATKTTPDEREKDSAAAGGGGSGAATPGPAKITSWKWQDESSTLYANRERDAVLALLYSLKVGVFLKAEDGVLSAKIWKELERWLQFVAAYFPRESLRGDLTDLVTRIDPSVTAEAWIKLLAAWAGDSAREDQLIREAFIPILTGGQDVVPSLRASTSFTGALWHLLHILTVSVDQQHPPHLSKDEDIEQAHSLRSAASQHTFPADRKRFYDRLRSFVSNFFGCDDCRRHFLDRFDKCAFGRCDTTQPSSLWLWELHNRVTQRVYRETVAHHHQDLAITNLEPKLLFPSPQQCPDCYWKEKPKQRLSAAEAAKWESVLADINSAVAGASGPTSGNNNAPGKAAESASAKNADSEDDDDAFPSQNKRKKPRPSSNQLFHQLFDKAAVEKFLTRTFYPENPPPFEPLPTEASGSADEDALAAGDSVLVDSSGILLPPWFPSSAMLFLVVAVAVIFFLSICRDKKLYWVGCTRKFCAGLMRRTRQWTLSRKSSAMNSPPRQFDVDDDTALYELDQPRSPLGMQRVGAYSVEEMI
ncbi:unnamed protein product [Amoebophrya sp. A120]|nr:unnamed protein product [Amoebophrya sp. A120]|eukprot:GSA120T00003676001.1